MPNDILQRARALAKRYRESVADLVAIIAEVERLKLFAEAGYPSLFEYCVKDLLVSEDDSYKMIQSARASNRRPEILSYLSQGELTARSVALLAPESRAQDFVQLLDTAKGKTVREVERLVATRHGAAPRADSIRAVGSVQAGANGPPKTIYRLGFDADEDLREMLDRAKGLLRHKYPDGRLEHVVREALSALLESIDPLEGEARAARLGARSNPHARQPPPAVRDEVWRRDEGRCTFVAADGRRCEATSWLEMDHVVPWALGGRSDDPANLRLLCRAHNQWAARQVFGPRPADGGG